MAIKFFLSGFDLNLSYFLSGYNLNSQSIEYEVRSDSSLFELPIITQVQLKGGQEDSRWDLKACVARFTCIIKRGSDCPSNCDDGDGGDNDDGGGDAKY